MDAEHTAAEPRQEITMDQALAHLREERSPEAPPEDTPERQPEERPERQPDGERPVYKNENQAYDAMQRRAEQADAAPAAEPAAEPEPEAPIVPADAKWSDAEVAEQVQLGTAWQQWQQRAAQFGQARQQAEQELRQGNVDLARAEMLRHQLRENERTLKDEFSLLQEQAQKLNTSATTRAQTAQQQLLEVERSKLNKAMPHIDTKVTRKFLEGRGFSAAEIDGLRDHRAVQIVEETRLYRELVKNQGNSGRGHVPKLRPGAGQRGEPEGAREFKDWQRRPANLAQLQAQHKRLGTVETAHALLTAKRQAAQPRSR